MEAFRPRSATAPASDERQEPVRCGRIIEVLGEPGGERCQARWEERRERVWVLVRRRVTMGLLFYPRGGSAQVVRYLAGALEDAGWSTELVCGSLGVAGETTNAASFYTGMDVQALDFSPAVEAFDRGEDAVAHDPPMSPSFEDRAGVPDRALASVSPELGDHLADAWARFLQGALRRTPGVLHVHHLSPLHEAFARVAPGTPLVTHLHGTEMKMIDRVDQLTRLAHMQGTDLAGMADRELANVLPSLESYPHEARELVAQTRWEHWRYGSYWASRLRTIANACEHFIVVSPHDRDEARRLLGVEDDRVHWIPNGVDTHLFDRREVRHDERVALWRRWLVDEPKGWDETGRPGSIRYDERDIAPLTDPHVPVLLFVGRFLDFKRVPLLIRAYAAARESFEVQAPLVIWGGFPGEWEGEHPETVASSLGLNDVFFVGWRGHEDLARGLSCCDVLVAPSKNEPFGLVFLEAMASGLPVIATRSGGPLSFVNTEPGAPNGWMVAVDDQDELTTALIDAVNDPGARRARSENAHTQIRSHYSWKQIANRFTDLYEHATSST
ncbi:MAG: glycosyltransferase [Actinobacteria bacterium]|nr:glycosyltransferase [Actinomycetota bacterium]